MFVLSKATITQRKRFGDKILDRAMPEEFRKMYTDHFSNELALKTAYSMAYELSCRDPHRFKIYVHNDFPMYGKVEVLENALCLVARKIDENKAIKALEMVEGIIFWTRYNDEISGIDDGQRFSELVKVFGAAVITVVRRARVEDIVGARDGLCKGVAEDAASLIGLFNRIGDPCTRAGEILKDLAAGNDDVEIDDDEEEVDFDERDFEFAEALETYMSSYDTMRQGGHSRDITMWPMKLIKEYSLDNIDARFG